MRGSSKSHLSPAPYHAAIDRHYDDNTSQNAKPKRGDDGFTLIEVLVSLTILSISLAVLMGVFGASLSHSREAQSRMEARRLASTLLANAEYATELPIGETSGRSHSGLVWQLQVARYGNAEDSQAWIARAAQIRATVSWGNGGSGQTVSLATLRLLPKAAPP